MTSKRIGGITHTRFNVYSSKIQADKGVAGLKALGKRVRLLKATDEDRSARLEPNGRFTVWVETPSKKKAPRKARSIKRKIGEVRAGIARANARLEHATKVRKKPKKRNPWSLF